MLGIFKKRWFVVALGLLLLSAFVWFAGPYFAFADFHPLAPVWVRVAVIVAILAIYFGGILVKQLKALRTSAKLAEAVSRQAPAASAGSADAEQLRERFAEAIATLKQNKNSGQSLYELPWYVIIGAPGSGKTTALMNSGLNFPLAQKFGKEALRGVGGTRNCDWWFTDAAVLLDTAGRYTTQDSDQSADSSGWREFLALLLKYRKRRPLNGIILTISATDLITQHQGEREAHVLALRRRLDEVNKELKVQLPVYLLITKCDLVAGFSEYFDDLPQEGRGQVWGVTFPYQLTTSGQAAAAFPAEFTALVTRLNERVYARVEEERDVKRRAAIFAFPQQWAGLGEVLGQYVQELFASSRFNTNALLRGVYFTSGTQEGTPIDRILGALGRSVGAAANVVSAPTGRGKAYFIERLLKDVMFAESGLAGVNRKLEQRKLLLQVATYASVALLTVLGVIAFSISYGRNRAYLNDVQTSLAQLQQPASPVQGASMEQVLPRLDAVRQVVTVADRYQDGTPLLMRWGLFQGNSIGNQARDAYRRELSNLLLPQVAQAIQQRLIAYTAEPDKLYEYLKTYLMLGQPEHLDKTQMQFLVELEWQAAYAQQPDVQERLTQHFQSLLEAQDQLRPIDIDMQLVAQARIAIKQASVPHLMYSRLKLNYLSDTDRAVRLDNELGLGAKDVLVRKSGKPLSEPIPALYTPAVFAEVSSLGTVKLIKQFADDQWVFGDDTVSLANSARTSSDLMAIYEQDYIRAWDEVLSDVNVASFPTTSELANGLAILSGPTSPLRALLITVDKNTYLVKSAEDAAKAGVVNQVKDGLGKLFTSAKQAAGAATGEPPGTQVTAHFASIHRLVDAAGGQPPIDRALAKMGQVQLLLQSVGTGIGQNSQVDPQLEVALKSLQQEAANLPPLVAGVVTQVTGKSASAAMGQARSELMNLYTTQVVRECSAVTAGRYPFDVRSGTDVPLADFGRLFGAGGVFDGFFKDNLQALVDTSRSPWNWRSGTGGTIGISNGVLRQFEQAQRIRDTYFRPGGQLPEVRFNVSVSGLDAAASRVLFEIDGQTIEYRHGPERTIPVVWPGPSPGAAAVSFEDRSGGRPNQVYQGPWAWFRLLERGNVQRQSDVRYLATWQAGGHDASMTVEATSIRNPLADNSLRQFRCGG